VTDEKAKSHAKGDRVAIVRGKKDVGARGEIFWIGENKYGPGMRYGIRSDDGATYWTDEASVGPEADAPPAPETPPLPALAKGTRVEITGGRDGKGEKGEIFWTGENKFGKGMRYGVRGDDGETHWVDGPLVTAIDEPAPPKKEKEGSERPPPRSRAPSADASDFQDFEDAPMPDMGDDDERAEVRPMDEDIPFPPDEDLPF
jgi:hypothetical protein